MSPPKRTIYLAGPISGLTHDDARYGWRKDFEYLLTVQMGLDHISCSSPMRGKEFLKDHGILSSGNDYPQHIMATSAGITTRDYNDVKMCDMMVACFLESNSRPSLGTAAEYGYCWALQKPILTIGPRDEINIRHPMLDRMTGWHADTLEDGALVVAHVLTPGL